MELTVHELQGQRFVACAPGTRLIKHVDDVRILLEACFDHGVDRVLLYRENLPDHFFDLSSGEAGAVLQKLRNYQIRLAIVSSPAMLLSRRFGELLADEQQGSYFRLCDNQTAATEWLCSG